MASLIKDKVKRYRGNLHVLCCTIFDICLHVLDAKHMIRLQQKTQKNIHHGKPFKVQTMEITKLFTVFVYFGRHSKHLNATLMAFALLNYQPPDMLLQTLKQTGQYHSADNGLTKSVRQFQYSHWLLRKYTVGLDFP